MDANPRSPDDARPDPMSMRPDCGGAGDFARWELAREAADRRETDADYDEHRRKFVAAGGRGSKFDALNLMAAARLKATRLLNGLSLSRDSHERPATEYEIRTVMGDMARDANAARCEGRLGAFRRRLWPSGGSPSPRKRRGVSAAPDLGDAPRHGQPSGIDASRPADGPECDAHDLDRWSDESGSLDAEVDPMEADHRVTAAAYAEYKRRFVEAGGSAPRFDALHLKEAARLQANRIWTVMTRARGDADSPASEAEVRKSLDGFAIEADAARSKGRLRAFARRLWPFGMPW